MKIPLALESPLNRRQLLKTLGGGLAAIPLVQLLGCSDESASGAGDPDAGGLEDADGNNAASDTGDNADASVTSGDWATGGTAAMTAQASYPDPFTAAAATTCALTCATTIGPCHTASPERVDVSDGWDGLPVRLSLRVLDEDCNPVEGVAVEIWHTNYKGVYSGRISTVCNKEEADRAAQYFRGYLRTDAAGRVDFDTCYPGSYPGRVVHIHFRIQTAYDAATNASAEVISQLFFSDDLNDALFTDQPLYSDYGLPNIQLGTDSITRGAADLSSYVLDVARMSDGVMLASKTVILRTSSAACRL